VVDVRPEKCGGEKKGEAARVYNYGGEALTILETSRCSISLTCVEIPPDTFVGKVEITMT